LILGQGQQGELAELEGLCFVERGEVGGGVVIGVSAITEDFEEGKVGRMLCGFGEGLDLWCLQEFGEDEGVCC
jgi:hypothetical protein